MTNAYPLLAELLEKETSHEIEASLLEIIVDISGMFDMDVFPDRHIGMGDARKMVILHSLAKEQLANLLSTLVELNSALPAGE